MADDNKSSSQKNPNPPLSMGLFTTAIGVFIILVSVDVIHADPSSIHAPRWVLTMTGMIFTFAGLYVLNNGLPTSGENATPVTQWIQYFLRLGILTAFAVTFLWVGFGGGEREFSGSGSIGFVSVSGNGNDILGRIMFGGGGLIAALLAGYFAFSEARKIMSNTSNRDSSWD